MARQGNLIHVACTLAFVGSGLAFIAWPQTHAQPPVPGGMNAVLLAPEQLALHPGAAESLPHLFLHPTQPAMWALLAALWILLVLDALGQWMDPSDPGLEPDPRQHFPGQPVWQPLSAALIAGAASPWLVAPLPWIAAAGTVIAALASFVATLRAIGQRRPAIGFLAGWSLGLAAAMLATLVAGGTGMTMGTTALLALLPAAVAGIAAQLWIGRETGFSIALIWAYCGLAAITVSIDAVAAITAMLGIAAMAGALVRVAS